MKHPKWVLWCCWYDGHGSDVPVEWMPYAVAITFRRHPSGHSFLQDFAESGFIRQGNWEKQYWRILPYGKLPRCKNGQKIVLPEGWNKLE